MINKKQAEMYCAQPIELIENYDKAMADQTQVWHCHHIWETMLGYSAEELIEMNEYYGIPACNLIFLTPAEHRSIHHKGKTYTSEQKRRMSEAKKGEKNPFYGKKHTEEYCMKISEMKNGEKHPMFGKHHTEEARRKISESKIGKYNTKKSKPVLQYTTDGELVGEYPSTAEVQRKTGYRQGSIARYARENKKLHGFIWKYKN